MSSLNQQQGVSNREAPRVRELLFPQRENHQGPTHPRQIALQLLIQKEVDGKDVAGAVGEHGVDHVAVLVAQLLGHVQHHTRAQVLQGNPAQQGDREPSRRGSRASGVMLTNMAAQDTQVLTHLFLHSFS